MAQFDGHPNNGIQLSVTVANTLDSDGRDGIIFPTSVRRLTPRECERLQAFPDDWTRYSTDGEQSDSARYRQLGNAVTVTVAEWIGRRIMDIHWLN